MVKGLRCNFLDGLAFCVPALVYLLTIAPDITWANQGWDGGDLITAAYTLGIPHPPGHPTYTLIGWVFGHIPLGSIGWRFNMLSAISMAGASWVIFKIMASLIDSRISALSSAWIFAFIPLVWEQALITEVYALNLFFSSLLLWLSIQIYFGKTRYAFFAGLVFGLGMGTHLTIIFLGPLCFWLWYSQRRTVATPTLSGFMIGLVIFVYLPLRTGKGAITWGEANTWLGFWDVVSGQIYRGYFFNLPWVRVGPRLVAVLGYLVEIGFIPLVLIFLGLSQAWSQARKPLIGSIITITVYIVYAVGYQTPDSFVYLLPVYGFLALGVGLGMTYLLTTIDDRQVRLGSNAVILALPLILGLLRFPAMSLRDDQTATRFWMDVFAEAPANAVLLTYQDNHTFTLWYAHYVLSQRPDLEIIDTGLLSYPWYLNSLSAHLLAEKNLSDGRYLSQLPDRFQQRIRQPYPLCAVLEKEHPESWFIDCLEVSTE